MQEAIAIGLEQSGPKKFFEDQLAAYTERRDILCSYFDQLGLSYTKPDGSYFLLVDMSPVKIPDGFEVPPSCQGRGKDFALCWWLAQELRVVGIPPSEVGPLSSPFLSLLSKPKSSHFSLILSFNRHFVHFRDCLGPVS
jgi:kynurenine aminotransferase